MSEQQVPEQPGSTPSTDASQPQAASPEAGRRRLLQGGLAAGPVIFTLFSRPALGVSVECKTPSGFLSGNVSQHGNPTFCSGLTPEDWEQSPQWPVGPPPYYPTTVLGTGGHQATEFHSVTTGFYGTQFISKTMLEVLQTGGALGRYITAALLNAAAGLTPVLSQTDVRNIWNEYVNKGYFEPSAGIKWYPDQIVEYLVTTMPL